MSILKMVTADMQTLDIFNSVFIDSGCSFEIDSTVARTGNSSFKVIADGSYSSMCFAEMPVPSNNGDLYIRVSFKLGVLDDTDTFTIVEICTPGYVQDKITINKAGEMALYHYSGNLDVVSGLNFLTGWNCLEIHIVISNTGSWDIRLNGVQVMVGTGDTMSGTEYDVSKIRFGVMTDGRAATIYFDDIMVRDDKWCGTGGIYLLVPDAAGDDSGWTASAGNAYECVDEVPPDGTDYIYTDAATPGTRHLFNISALPVTPDSISGICVISQVQLDQTGTGTIKNAIKSGATISYGPDVGISDGAIFAEAYWDQNPDTSLDWTETDINALQIGIETV